MKFVLREYAAFFREEGVKGLVLATIVVVAIIGGIAAIVGRADGNRRFPVQQQLQHHATQQRVLLRR